MAVTFRALRRALGLSLDDLSVQAVSAGTATGGTFDLFRNPTAGAASTRYNGRWLYVSTGDLQGQQVRIRTDGFDPTTGGFSVFPDWAPPASSDEVELTALFPVFSNPIAGVMRSPQDGDADYRTMLNRALGRLVIPSRLTIPITTADSYSLAAYPWLDRLERIRRDGDDARLLRVLEPPITAGRRPMSSAWRGWRLVVDGTDTALEVGAPFSTATGSLIVEVMRPANTLASGVEVSSIASDDSLVDVTVEDVLPAAKAEAYAVLANRPSNPFPRASELAAFWADEAKKSRFWDHSNDGPAPARAEAA